MTKIYEINKKKYIEFTLNGISEKCFVLYVKTDNV